MGYCGSLTYGHGLGMCQTEANGVIMAESSLGDSTWDPFDLMNIPVSNAGPGGTIYVPGIPGSAGEDIFSSGWGDYGLLAEAGTEQSLGINYSSPGEIDLSSGNAFLTFGAQVAAQSGGSAAGGALPLPRLTAPSLQALPASQPGTFRRVSCTVSRAHNELTQLFSIDETLAPFEARIVPAAGMIVAGTGVALASSVAIYLVPSSAVIAGPVGLGGLGLAGEGAYYGATGRIYVPGSCQ